MRSATAWAASSPIWRRRAPGVDCAVGYYGVGIEGHLNEKDKIRCPMVLHFAGEDKYCPKEAQEQIKAAFASRPDVEIYVYPGQDHAFARTMGDHFNKPSADMAHSRSIALFRRVMGPKYDLSALWDKHCEYEFGTRDVAATMKTMVPEPYVNHIPTMTGGVGQQELARFYQHHFVNGNPADTKLVPMSRTIGADRVVDEMLFCFTHDREIDWMLPGVAPDRQVCRGAAGRHRLLPRRQDLSRAHLLGSGDGAGADRPDRQEQPAGGGRREREEAAR